MKLETIEELQALVRDGFSEWSRLGHVRVRERDGLMSFDYTSRADAAGRWTFLERISRGLLLDRRSGEVVARPFDKFFNWGEGGRTTDAPVVRATEKIDGSLGILFRGPKGPAVATRSGPWSDVAELGTSLLPKLEGLPADVTLLFEIVDPRSPKIIDYGGEARLVLLAARNRHTGVYVDAAPFARFGFELAAHLDVDDIETVLQRSRDAEHEGFVTEHADGSRFKIKSHAYLAKLRLAHGFSERRVAKALAEGRFDAMVEDLPEELRRYVQIAHDAVIARVEALEAQMAEILEHAPASEAEVGRWLKREHPKWRRYLLDLRKGKSIRKRLLRREI